MLFLREILLLAVVLCVCWETGDARCGVKCDESQRGLPLPTCYLRDDGTSTECRIDIRNTDTEMRTLGNFDKLTLVLDLQTRVNRLRVYNYISNQLKVSAFRFHREITSLTIQYRNIQIHPGMFFLLPDLKYLRIYSVFSEYFPYFAYTNRFLTHLFILGFDIPSANSRILAGGHVSGLTRLKFLYLSPNQYINTTDQSFTGLTALTTLYLRIFHIPNPVTTLSPLVRLRQIGLHGDISFLTRTPSLYGLTYLRLYDNLITRIQPGIFSGYTNLVYLHLYGNRIAQLDCGAFTGLNNLKYLYLSSNPIQNICFTAFKGLESLAGLYLQSTSLTSISSRMFEYLPSLEYIDLYRTPLHCNCSLQWLSRVQHNFGLFGLLAMRNARCSSPSEHNSKLASDLSIYKECTRDLSYQCFNRSISCPSGTSCRDTLDTYICVCQQVGDLFDRSLNKCVSSEKLSSGLPKLNGTTPTYATSPTATSPTSTCATCPTTTCATCPSCPTSTCATCPSCPTSTCATCSTATCPSCPTTTCATCPTTAAPTI